MEAIDLNAAYTAFANEGATLFAQGKHMAAFTCFWKAFRIRPGAPVNLFNLGRTMEQLKDPRAEDFYIAAAGQGNADALYQLATIYMASGRTEAAVEPLRVYLKSKPEEGGRTQWARKTLHTLYPVTRLELVWKNPEKPNTLGPNHGAGVASESATESRTRNQ
jgi:tetratricopeptide (TPR) repeat protein